MNAIAREAHVSAGSPHLDAEQIRWTFDDNAGEVAPRNARQSGAFHLAFHIANVAGIDRGSAHKDPDLCWRWPRNGQFLQLEVAEIAEPMNAKCSHILSRETTFLLEAHDRRLSGRALSFGLPRQNGETERLQLVAQLFDRLKTDCADPGGARLLQIYLAVVDKKCGGRLHAESLNAVLIDRRLGLDAAHFAGKNVVIEMPEPREIVSHVRGHIGRHVG